MLLKIKKNLCNSALGQFFFCSEVCKKGRKHYDGVLDKSRTAPLMRVWERGKGRSSSLSRCKWHAELLQQDKPTDLPAYCEAPKGGKALKST